MTMKNRLKAYLLVLTGLSVVLPADGQPIARQVREASVSTLSPEKYVWNWRDAVLMEANIQLYRSDREAFADVPDRIFATMDKFAPTCSGRHPNAIASGVGLAFLWTEGLATPQMKAAAEKVYEQYRRVLRTPSGACSHRHNRVELWDDTLYMVGIFLLEMYRATGDERYLNDLVEEIVLHAEVLRDSATGLWYHGWSVTTVPVDDECGEYGWNTNPLRRNGEFWGRGNGWIAMILSDVLEVLPSDDTSRPEIEGMYLQMMKTLRCLQDRRSGMWRQLPLRKRDKDNFLESSGTAMFGYAVAKGVRLGLLGKAYAKTAAKAYDGLCSLCIEGPGTPDATLGRICEGTCVGSRDYYYSRRTVSGDSYAVGAFLMFANETENI